MMEPTAMLETIPPPCRTRMAAVSCNIAPGIDSQTNSTPPVAASSVSGSITLCSFFSTPDATRMASTPGLIPLSTIRISSP